jgi:hypothetical protein
MATTTSQRRSPLTVDAHRALGKQLSEARNNLLHAEVELCNTYGRTKPPSRAADRALKAIEQLRSHLDDQLAHDHPDDFDPNVYYPLRQRAPSLS